MITLFIIAGGFITFGYLMVLRIKGFDYKKRQDIILATQKSQNTLMNEKLDVIHMLVNGAMTSAMEGELDSNIRDAASMREVVELRRASGQDPNGGAKVAIENMDKRIEELRAAIKIRHEQALTDRVYVCPQRAVVAQSAEASGLSPDK